jgi:hypothetical protein
VLSSYGREVVVAAVRERRGSKDDRRYPFGLANDLRLGVMWCGRKTDWRV